MPAGLKINYGKISRILMMSLRGVISMNGIIKLSGGNGKQGPLLRAQEMGDSLIKLLRIMFKIARTLSFMKFNF